MLTLNNGLTFCLLVLTKPAPPLFLVIWVLITLLKRRHYGQGITTTAIILLLLGIPTLIGQLATLCQLINRHFPDADKYPIEDAHIKFYT